MNIERSGRLEVIAGVMFSGKSEELIRRVRRSLIAQRQVRVFTSMVAAHDADSAQVVSHAGRAIEALAVERSDQILRAIGQLDQIDLVAIDEAQFLDAGIVEVATHLAENGVRTICAGTDTDFRGEPFGMMGHLMAIAESVTKLAAICMVCGKPACRNQRLVAGKPAHWNMPIVMPGGADQYQARCRRCFVVPRPDEEQVPLL